MDGGGFPLLIEHQPRSVEGELLPPQPSFVVYRPHPFSRTTHYAASPSGRRISEIVADLKLPQAYSKHIRVWIDDVEVPAEYWTRVRPREGRNVYVAVVPQGGGGGGKNIIRVVAFVAIAIFAAWAAPALALALAPALGISTAAGSFGLAVLGGVIGMGITMVGSLIVNALIPPTPPQAMSAQSFDVPSISAGSGVAAPRYQLTGVGNKLEKYANIPRVFGKRKVYPLLAAQPYTEIVGKDEYLRLALLVGWGRLQITDIKIGETPIAAFEGVEYEVREGASGDAALTKYTNSVSQSNFNVDLASTVTWSTRTSVAASRELSVDIGFPSGLAYYNNAGGRDAIAVQFQVQYRQYGTSGAWINPTWLNAADDGFATPGYITVTSGDGATLRVSGRWTVASGQYDVRILRVTALRGARYVESASWTVLRSVTNATPIVQTGLCLIGLRIKATGQLNGVPNSINCIAESYLPVWNGTTWTDTISRSPAWAFVDIMRRRGPETRLTNDRIDLTAMMAWATACAVTAPNASEAYWTFDAVIEGGSVFDNLRMIASHARALYTMKDGKHSIVRDIVQTVPVQHITPRNSTGYDGRKNFVDQPHALRVKFVNAANGYTEDEVIVYADGYTSANATRFEPLDLPACASSTQAWREGRYHLAVGTLRPEEHVVAMDIEALNCTLGDYVLFTHDAVSIGIMSTRIASMTVNGASAVTTITLEDEIYYEAATSYVLRIRKSTGDTLLVSLNNPGVGYATVVTPSSPISAGVAPAVGDLVMFGEASRETAPMIVKKIEPGRDFTVRVTMVDAQAGVWTADTGTIPAFNTYITTTTPPEQAKPGAPTFGTVRSDETALLRLVDGTLVDRIAVEIVPPVGSAIRINAFEVQYRETAATSWISRMVTASEAITVYLDNVRQGENYTMRARAISSAFIAGSWTSSTTHTVVGKTTPPSAPATMTATVGVDGVSLVWDAITDVDFKEYEIRRGASWAAGTLIAKVHGTSLRIGVLATGSYTYRVKAIDQIGLYSATDTSATATVSNPGTVASFTATLVDFDCILDWTAPTYGQAIALYEIRYGASYAAGTLVAQQQGTRLSVPINWSGARTFWIAAIDVAGNTGTATSVVATVSSSSDIRNLQYSFVADQVVITWDAPTTINAPLDYYEVRHGASWGGGTSVGIVRSFTFSMPAIWLGNRTFWVNVTDVNGNSATEQSIVVPIAVAAAPTLSTQVLDNNVLLYWSQVQGTLPTETYELRRGSTWAGATLVGRKSGGFTSVFETAAGTYTYWIAAVDVAGNYGSPISVTSVVAQPPDYILTYDANSTFSGTKSNMVLDSDGSGSYVMPVDTSETYSAHFTSRGWAGPSAQVSAGYPIFIEPSTTTSYYEETVDYGVLLASTKIELTIGATVLAGAPVQTTNIQVSADGATWIDYGSSLVVYAVSFRYLKYRITYTSSGGDDLVRLTSINVRLDEKLINDAGMLTANAADVGGTTVTFRASFIDVQSINVTAAGSTMLTAIYDFVDVPFPTTFKVYLFNSAGTRVSGLVSWAARGV